MSMQLPHKAKGIRIGSVQVMFPRDKIVIAPPGDWHVTIHSGPHSGSVDVHETHRTTESVSHRTLYTISHESLERLLAELGPQLPRLLSELLDPLRPGWMARQGLVPVLGWLSDTHDELAAVTKVRSRKLEVSLEKLRAAGRIPEYVDDLLDLPDGSSFTLVRPHKRKSYRVVGIGFKATDSLGRKRLSWLCTKTLLARIRPLRQLFTEAALRYGTVHEPWAQVLSPARVSGVEKPI